MGTGGSRGIRTSQDYVRRGGAAARMMLLQAAANRWSVPVERAHRLQRRHHARALEAQHPLRQGRCGCRQADGRPTRTSIKLKDPRSWKVAGKPVKRLDTADKLDGSKKYAIDLQFPGMLNAAIKQCPVFGGKLVSFDAAAIAKRPGVRGAVQVDDRTVAVVADTWWHAKTALDALPIVWDEGAGATQSSAKIAEHLAGGLTAPNAYAGRNEGDALKAIDGAAKHVEAVYSTPFLAHATMEPMNCTARVTAERAEAWVPTQNAEASLAALSEVAGIPIAQVRGVPPRSRLRLRPARRHAGLHAPGGRHRQAVSRRAREADLEPRGGPGAGFLPADLAVQAGRRARCGGKAGRPARARFRAVDQRLPQRGDGRRRQGPPPAAGHVGRGGRRAARLHGAEPAGRVRDAQHPRAGRPVARRQHQPERRLHRVLHRGVRARRGRRFARVPPRADAEASEAPRGAERRRGEARAGASRCPRACIAASRSSWATAATRRRWPRSRWPAAR